MRRAGPCRSNINVNEILTRSVYSWQENRAGNRLGELAQFQRGRDRIGQEKFGIRRLGAQMDPNGNWGAQSF